MLFQSVQPTMWMLLMTVCIAHLDLMQTHHPCRQMFCPLHKTHAYGDVKRKVVLKVQQQHACTRGLHGVDWRNKVSTLSLNVPLPDHASLMFWQSNGLVEAVLQLHGCVGSVDSNSVASGFDAQCFQHDRLRSPLARCVSILHGRQKILCGRQSHSDQQCTLWTTHT